MIPKILLSFDVEEFDMPLEYGFSISPEQQMQVGKLGLDKFCLLYTSPSPRD